MANFGLLVGGLAAGAISGEADKAQDKYQDELLDYKLGKGPKPVRPGVMDVLGGIKDKVKGTVEGLSDKLSPAAAPSESSDVEKAKVGLMAEDNFKKAWADHTELNEPKPFVSTQG